MAKRKHRAYDRLVKGHHEHVLASTGWEPFDEDSDSSEEEERGAYEEPDDEEDDPTQDPLSDDEEFMEQHGLSEDDPNFQEKFLQLTEDQQRVYIQHLERKNVAKVAREKARRGEAKKHAKASDRLRNVDFKKHDFEGWKEQEIPYRVEPKEDLNSVKEDILPPKARGHVDVVHPDDIRDVDARLQKIQKLRDELEGGKGAGSVSPPRTDTKGQRVQAGIDPKKPYDPTKDKYDQTEILKGKVPAPKPKGSFNKASTELAIETLKERLKPYNTFIDPKSGPSDKPIQHKGEITTERLILQQELKHQEAHLAQINEGLDRYDKQIKQLKDARQRLKKNLKQSPITPRTEPVVQAPTQEQLKQEVADYNRLRKEDQKSLRAGKGGIAEELSPQEAKRYADLRDKTSPQDPRLETPEVSERSKPKNIRSYDEEREFQALDKRYKKMQRYAELESKLGPNGTYKLTVEPTKEQKKLGKLTGKAKTPDELEEERLNKEVDSRFSVEQKGEKPRTRYIDPEGNEGDEEQESIEGEIGKYGQEDPGAGWGSTYKFNKEQLDRKYKGLITGESAVGFGEQGKKGYGIWAPTEKAKVTFGPNQQIIKHAEWTPADPDKAIEGYDKFEVELNNSTHPERHYDSQGRYYKQGRDLKETLNSMGLELQTEGANPTPKDASGTRYTIRTKGVKRSEVQIQQERERLEKAGVSPEKIQKRLANQVVGRHLNPDEIAYLQQELHKNYGVKSFKASNTVKFNRKSYKMPAGYNKLPKGVTEDQIVRSKLSKNLYTKPIGTRFGERDERGELLPGESDTVGIRIPGVKGNNKALQYNFREDTDAIGWGTSYRPGNKEISAVALAYPRARRERHIMEAKSNKQLDEIIAQEHPEAETDEEKKQWRSRYRKHGKELASAAAASGYYSAKKGLPSKIGGKIYYGAIELPGIGPKVQWVGEKTNIQEFLKDSRVINNQVSYKMERAKKRLLNPTASLDDPTRFGITSDKKLNVPKWRYRKFPIGIETREARKHEKDVRQLAGALETRLRINNFLLSNKKNMFKKWQARAAAHADPEKRLSDNLVNAVEQKQTELDKILKGRKVVIGDQRIIRKDNPEMYEAYKEKIQESQNLLTGLHKIIKKYPEQLDYDELKTQYNQRYPHILREHLPKPVRIGGEVALGAAVLGGGTIYSVDKYQTYKHNKGEHISHPILKAITPETISIPKLKVKKTRELTIPDNTLTNALDFEGEKLPVAWRVSVVKEQKARLQNHKDISGQGYESGLPILGGLGLTAPTATKGSMKKALLPQAQSSDLGATKNIYIKGKKVPIDMSVGKKERWSAKGPHKLRAKYNRFNLSQEDREKLVYDAGQSSEKEQQIKSFYHGDKQLEEMLDNPEELSRVEKKLAKNKYSTGGRKSIFTPVDQYTTSAYEKSQG